MNIIVLIKQVPDTTDVKLHPKTGNLIRDGLESIINPDDLHAIKAAVSIKEKHGGKITAISMGPAQAVDALTEAIGIGADNAILLSDKAFAGADTWATSFTLGKAIEKIGEFDLIICGRQAIDGDTAQIGPQVADYLDIPQATYVCDIEEIKPEEMILKRRTEEGSEKISCQLPALITVIGELNDPEYANMARLISACDAKAPIKIWNAADIGVKINEVGLEGSLTNVLKTFAPKFKREGEFLSGSKEEIVRSLIKKFEDKGFFKGKSATWE